MSDNGSRSMPMVLARLIHTQAVDLAAEVSVLLAQGQRRITLGLGPGVDVPLLDEELHAAEVAMLDREIVVATLRAEPDGYVVERGWTNFGIYVWSEREPIWQSVPWMGEVRGLRPGDRLALGSTPAEALKLVFPDSPLVPPRTATRSVRQKKAADRAPSTPSLGTPPPAMRTPAGSEPRKWKGGPPDKYQRLFEMALLHWHYAMYTIGTDPKSTIAIDDVDLAELRLAIGRNPSHPDRGYELFVKGAGGDPWVQPAGRSVRSLAKGSVERLRGASNRMGFGPYVVELPAPAVPAPRFGAREEPTRADIAEILGLKEADLKDGERVKARYRDLARRFHPDRHSGDPGDTSRFLEIQTCFEAWRAAAR
jgi:hypothetical protein